MIGLALGSWILLVLAVIGFPGSFTFARPTARGSQDILGDVWFALIVVGMVSAMLYSKERGRRGWLLLRHAKIASVKCYSGPISDETRSDPAYIKLRRYTGTSTEGTLSIEVLAPAGRIRGVNDQRLRQWVQAISVTVAEQPPFAAIAAQWLEPVRREDPSVLGGRRELSAEERDEISRLARRAWTKPLPAAAIFTTWLLMILTLITLSTNFHSGSAFDTFRFVLLVILTIMADGNLANGIRISAHLVRDRDGGMVTIMQSSTDVTPYVRDASLKDDRSAESPSTPEQSTTTIELLPISGMIWTENARPAAWRRIAFSRR
ncbi:MAG: hypothetical protein ACLQVD_21550 [Capsulimonadaceae bacterium]